MAAVSLFGWAAHLASDLGRPHSHYVTAATFSYVAGALALGALSVGQEFGHRTMGPLLSQPLPRWRVLVVKLVALAPLLALLAWLADAMLVEARPEPWEAHYYWLRTRILLPVFVGFGLAPCLTLVSRSALAGAVFSGSLPLLVGLAGRFLEREFDWLLWHVGVTLSAAGGLLAWSVFLKLQVHDRPPDPIDVNRWFDRPMPVAAVGTRRPWRRLLMKELRLQQMTFVVAGIFVVLWVLVRLGRNSDAAVFYDGPLLSGLTTVYCFAIAMLAGALACAEERHHGAAEWQRLLPVSARRQWALKVGVALVLAVGLGGLLPALLPVDPSYSSARRDWPLLFLPTVLTGFSLFVSSLSTSGIRAFLTSIPVVATASNVVMLLSSAVPASANRAINVRFQLVDADRTWIWQALTRVTEWTGAGLAIGLVLFLIRLGFDNYRWADRSRARIGQQALWIFGYLFVGAMVMTAVPFVFSLVVSSR
jgi:hypothetical protein